MADSRPLLYTIAQLDLILQGGGDSVVHRVHLKECVLGVVLRKSMSTRIHHLMHCTGNSEEYVDGFVWDLICAKRISKCVV